jgi:hypothetical protein
LSGKKIVDLKSELRYKAQPPDSAKLEKERRCVKASPLFIYASAWLEVCPVGLARRQSAHPHKRPQHVHTSKGQVRAARLYFSHILKSCFASGQRQVS